MTTHPASSAHPVLITLGDFRWLRAHISVYAIGVVFLASINLLIGGSRLWSLTAAGIWSMLLIVHLVVLAISRLSAVLMAEDDEEIVLLPIKDALIVDPKPDPTATWDIEKPAEPAPTLTTEGSGETVSWQIATDAAQVKRTTAAEPENKS